MSPRSLLAGAAVAAAWLGAAALAACGRSSVQHDPPTTCAKVGDVCTYAPGKLGVCVEPMAGASARRGLVCQSQH
jgi:hypothetical protein